jgi:hypothetical protein
MNIEKAKHFAEQWIQSWNNHDLNAIIAHYADEFEFHSPFITLLKFSDTGIINNIADLKRYFEVGLKTYPELHFKLHHYFLGINTIVLYYTSINDKLAAEFFELNEFGKAVKVYCHYVNNNQL